MGDYVGSAYIYRYHGATAGWKEEAKLFAPDWAEDDNFGVSVSVSGDLALVGAPTKYVSGVGHWVGSAYLFRYDGTSWIEEEILTALDGGSENALFGWSVSVSGGVGVAGARDDADMGTESGSADVFNFLQDFGLGRFGSIFGSPHTL